MPQTTPCNGASNSDAVTGNNVVETASAASYLAGNIVDSVIAGSHGERVAAKALGRVAARAIGFDRSRRSSLDGRPGLSL